MAFVSAYNWLLVNILDLSACVKGFIYNEELRNVYDAIDERRKIDEIDRESIVCTYEGHTVFSIFSDYDDVYE